jgi:hypothetical protein
VAEDQIGYEALTQDAMRSVVRSALLRATGATGLPGKHHFYVTFRTHAPGVVLPEHLKARYPEEITIVLEHQFWDLEVYQDRFRVILKFGGQPYPIVAPFAAITRFYDPSVRFGLQFEGPLMAQADEVETAREAFRAAAAHEAAYITQPSETARDSDNEAGDVVSLDAFRKKK